MDIGPTQPAGMGRGPIGWGAITDYARATASRIRPWEAKLLRRLSLAWLAETARAEHPYAAPPFAAPMTADRRQAQEDALMRLLG